MEKNELKLKSLMNDIDDIIKPKPEKLVLGHLEILIGIYTSIKEDEQLYPLALKKHKTKMRVLEYILRDEIRLISLQEKINQYAFVDSEIVLEVPNAFDAEELILLNYLYNLIIGAFIRDKEITIKLYPKEEKPSFDKRKYLQRK